MTTGSHPSKTDSTPSRYVVGFDLGTTNSAVCYVDTQEEPWHIRTFAMPQWVAAGMIEARETLPSFHYQPTPGEMHLADAHQGKHAASRHWAERVASNGEANYVVGTLARDQGTLTPARMIHSAKSWLCHSGVDRTAAILPWHAADDVDRLSPVEISARYLAHVHDAWNAKFPNHPLEEQDFVLTLPASFDEIARELTIKAAAMAGLPRVVLIEEPQAAFYAWIDAHRNDWEQLVEPGQKILVCDIGGGTSDFTLIRVRRGEGGKVQFHRVAVGDHLILGGDNFDLALAQYLEEKATHGGKLEPRQWAVLVGICRQLKENMLGANPPESLSINLPGAGSRLIGGGLQIEVTRDEVRKWLLDGFFPKCGLGETPQGRRSGFQEFGLPYAPDAAITRYLAAFLSAHRHVAMDDVETPQGVDPARPDIVLFNGGVFLATAIRQRLLDTLSSWFSAAAPWQPVLLDNDRLDLAVARGAAYYGMVRRGLGVRIAAGLARTYYIGVEAAEPAAVCLLPASIEPGQDVELSERPFRLLVSQPVEFPLYVSSTRLTDKPGELVPLDRERMTPLPPIRTVLQTRKRSDAGSIEICLHAKLTEIGTLDLWCAERGGRSTWRLQFDIRSATQTDIAAHETDAEREGYVDESIWEACRTAIEETFGEGATAKPEGLVKRLSAAAGMSRNEWPSSLCRRIWEALMDCEAGRRRSAVHEARWLNLLGFGLRPGYGLAVDDWRVAETWRMLQGKFIHAAPICRSEGFILWRRIAGGLSAGQQQAVAEPLVGPIRSLHRQLTTGKGRGGDFTFSAQDSIEIWRLLGSLELLPLAVKIDLGGILLDVLPKRKMASVVPAILFALGRLGARVPMYGPLNGVVPADTAAAWLERLMAARSNDAAVSLAVMQLARCTDDRYRDIADKARTSAMHWLKAADAPSHFLELVRTGGALDAQEQGMIFGESLPKGLVVGQAVSDGIANEA